MTATKQPMPPAEVAAMLSQAEALIKAVRPMLKTKQIDWHRISQVLGMVRDVVNEPAGTILDWELERMRFVRDAILGPDE